MTETVVTIDRNPSSGQPKSAPGTQQTPSGGQTNVVIKFNPRYFATVPGLLKIAQLVLGIICMSCISGYYGSHSITYFLFVAVVSFIATVLWTFAYLLGIRELINLAINWILTEFLNTLIATILYLFAFIFLLAFNYGGAAIAAGIFGLLNTLAYAAGTYILYIEHRSGSTQ